MRKQTERGVLVLMESCGPGVVWGDKRERKNSHTTVGHNRCMINILRDKAEMRNKGSYKEKRIYKILEFCPIKALSCSITVHHFS